MSNGSHQFDPGYSLAPFDALVANFPGADTYPNPDFRTEWGPVFHRGRLDGGAVVLVFGQDPGAHEAVVRRILVGEAGQRIQGFLAKLGITQRYVMVNTFLYSVYGQHGGERHRADPAIAAYRHQWLDALLMGRSVDAVIALGSLAGQAFGAWQKTPSGQATAVAFKQIIHPTFPEGQKTKPRAEATRDLLKNWNDALVSLRPLIKHPDIVQPTNLYGTKFDEAKDLIQIPEADLPAGLPAWMRSLRSWAQRKAVNTGDLAEEKRATIIVRIPKTDRKWLS